MTRDLGLRTVGWMSPRPDRRHRALAPLAPNMPMPRARYKAPRQRDNSRQRSTRPSSARSGTEAEKPTPKAFRIAAPTPPLQCAATDADLRMFKRLVVFHKYDYALQVIDWVTRTRSDWRRLPTDRHPALSAEQVYAHLEQRESIAAYAAKRPFVINGEYRRRAITKHLLVDLDSDGSDEDLRSRVDAVRRALGEPTFVQMSPGGGVHMVYLFGRETPLLNLRGPGGRSGSVMRLLREQGLAEIRGAVEVFPADKSWQAAENGCRLPFGPGSYLLDSQTLCIKDSTLCGINALRYISARLASGELAFVDVNAWHARAAKLPRLPRDNGRVVANAFEVAKPFLDHGLRKFGERRRALLALAHHWLWQNEPESRAVALAQEWLRLRHNDCSRTWNEAHDKQAVLDECEEIVTAVYRVHRLRVAKNTNDLPLLTVDEVRPLLLLALKVASSRHSGRPVTFTARTKRVPIDPVKLVELGVHMLRCFVARLECIAMEAFTKGGGDFSDAYRRVLSRCRPNFAAQRFRLPLPRAAMLQRRAPEEGEHSRGKRAVGKDRVAAYLGFLLQNAPEDFRMASDFHAQQYKSRDYWVPVDLYGERVVETGADAWALAELIDSIRPLVSRYLWVKKLQPSVKKLSRDLPYARPLAFALRGVRMRIDAGVQGRLVQRHLDAGGTVSPVAADWKPGSPEQPLLRLPEHLRLRVEDLKVTLNVMMAMELAPFVRLDHLNDLRRDTQEILCEAFATCFPNAAFHVKASIRPNTSSRVRVHLASDAAATDVAGSPDEGGPAFSPTDQDGPDSVRRLKRAISGATRAALRDAIFRRNLHMHADLRQFDGPTGFSRDSVGATPPPR